MEDFDFGWTPYFRLTPSCDLFARGRCDRGDKCIYKHDNPPDDVPNLRGKIEKWKVGQRFGFIRQQCESDDDDDDDESTWLLFVHISEVRVAHHRGSLDVGTPVTYTHKYNKHKKKFYAGDVSISDLSQQTGHVTKWNHHRNYGIIQFDNTNGRDTILVHASDIAGRNNCLEVGKKVVYTKRYFRDKDRYQAAEVEGEACYEFFNDEQEWRKPGTKVVVYAANFFKIHAGDEVFSRDDVAVQKKKKKTGRNNWIEHDSKNLTGHTIPEFEVKPTSTTKLGKMDHDWTDRFHGSSLKLKKAAEQGEVWFPDGVRQVFLRSKSVSQRIMRDYYFVCRISRRYDYPEPITFDHSLIGRRINMRIVDRDNNVHCHFGKIDDFVPQLGYHRVKYDDGREEWHILNKETFRIYNLAPRKATIAKVRGNSVWVNHWNKNKPIPLRMDKIFLAEGHQIHQGLPEPQHSLPSLEDRPVRIVGAQRRFQYECASEDDAWITTELDESTAARLLELKSSNQKGLEVYIRPLPRVSLLSDKEKKDARDAFAADEEERERREAQCEAARQVEQQKTERELELRRKEQGHAATLVQKLQELRQSFPSVITHALDIVLKPAEDLTERLHDLQKAEEKVRDSLDRKFRQCAEAVNALQTWKTTVAQFLNPAKIVALLLKRWPVKIENIELEGRKVLERHIKSVDDVMQSMRMEQERLKEDINKTSAELAAQKQEEERQQRNAKTLVEKLRLVGETYPQELEVELESRVNSHILKQLKGTVHAVREILQQAAKDGNPIPDPQDPSLKHAIAKRDGYADSCFLQLQKAEKDITGLVNRMVREKSKTLAALKRWKTDVAQLLDPAVKVALLNYQPVPYIDIEYQGQYHLERRIKNIDGILQAAQKESKALTAPLTLARNLLDKSLYKSTEQLRKQLVDSSEALEDALDDIEDAEAAKRKAIRRKRPYNESSLLQARCAAQKRQRALRRIARLMFQATKQYFPELEAGEPAKVLTAICNIGNGLPQKSLLDFNILEEKNVNNRGVRVLFASRVEDKSEVVLKGFPHTEKRRLERELTRVALLPTHPFIVPYISVVVTPGDSMGMVYIEMPKYNEGTLADWIQTTPHRDDDLKRKLTRQLFQAIEAVHKAGIVHKDIKPENIIMTNARSTILLTDFDISHSDADAGCHVRATTTAVRGTAGYMPPELLHGTKSSSKSDIYSAGATIYELHFGEPPPPPPRKREISVDKKLNKLLHALLERDPRARPSATQALTFPYFTDLEGSRECEICMDDHLVELGVICDHEDSHFFCRSCFEEYVQENCDVSDNMEAFRRKEGSITCPTCSEKFALPKIATCVPPPVLEKFMEARRKLFQQLEQEKAQRQMQKELLTAEKKIRQDVLDAVKASDDARMRVEVMNHRRKVEETILCLSCPRCHQVFSDFTGCAALTCSRKGCGCSFCAFCLQDCGDDAHRHVANCTHRPRRMNGVYFTSDDDFEGVQRGRRQRLLESYFAGKVEKSLHQHLYEALREQLKDLGLKPDPSWIQAPPNHVQKQIEIDELLAKQLAHEDGYVGDGFT